MYWYRAENFQQAFPDFEKAFNQAKYSAGTNQYKLVNQYVEVAAKTDNWKSFKKAVQWAEYLGIEIRHLRQEPPTDENLRSVYEIFKKTRYGDL